jgi:exopolyphosphatase/guanosine-5'-triphosphate,3'-diphosphate pyrophosphatase
MILCLRIAMILHRHRDSGTTPLPDVTRDESRIRIAWPQAWQASHPLTHGSLQDEIAGWTELGAIVPFTLKAD